MKTLKPLARKLMVGGILAAAIGLAGCGHPYHNGPHNAYAAENPGPYMAQGYERQAVVGPQARFQHPDYAWMQDRIHGQQQGFGPMADLSAEQQEQMLELRNSLHNQHAVMMESMQQAQQELALLYQADDADQASIDAAKDKINGLHQTMQASREQVWKQMNELLTDEQQEAMQEQGYGLGMMGPGTQGYGMMGQGMGGYGMMNPNANGFRHHHHW